jgi:hypothetical protein
MLTPAKAKEKPSIASKKVLNTHRKNGTESFLLTEKIRTLEHKQSQKNIDIDMEMNSLKKRIENVQRVKQRIGLSTERRMLLKSQGFTIRVCKGGQEDEIVLRRESLEVEAGNWATLLTNPPDFTLPDESKEIQDVVESSETCTSSLVRLSLFLILQNISCQSFLQKKKKKNLRKIFVSLVTFWSVHSMYIDRIILVKTSWCAL